MRYAYRFLCLLGVVFALALSAFAVDSGLDATEPTELPVAVETIPVVALDPESVQAIADAVNATEPGGGDLPDSTEPTTPVVDLSPDTVSALSQAFGDVLSSAADDTAAYAASAISGGYYFVADCALGNNIKFYIPVDFAVDCFALDSGGLVNMTNTTVYALAPDYPDYTISCSRFGHFTYRRNSGSGYQTYDLNISQILKTNLSLLDSDPPEALPGWQYWIVLIVVVILFGVLLCFFRRH